MTMCAAEKQLSGWGRRLRYIRDERLKKGREELAPTFGVKAKQIERWESEDNEPSLEVFRRFASLGKVRFAWLLDEDGPMELDVQPREQALSWQERWKLAVDKAAAGLRARYDVDSALPAAYAALHSGLELDQAAADEDGLPTAKAREVILDLLRGPKAGQVHQSPPEKLAAGMPRKKPKGNR